MGKILNFEARNAEKKNITWKTLDLSGAEKIDFLSRIVSNVWHLDWFYLISRSFSFLLSATSFVLPFVFGLKFWMELHWIRLFFAFFPTRISPSLPLPFIGSFSVLRTNRAITREAFFGPVLDRCFVLFFLLSLTFRTIQQRDHRDFFLLPPAPPQLFFSPSR